MPDENTSQAPEAPMTPEQADQVIGRLTALAMNPKVGEPFTLADKTFTRQFVKIDTEQELTAIVVRVMLGIRGQNVAEAFLHSTGELRAACALILADQDPTADEEWLKTTRGVTTLGMLDIVVAQLALNNVVPLLGKLLTIAGTANLVTALRGS